MGMFGAFGQQRRPYDTPPYAPTAEERALETVTPMLPAGLVSAPYQAPKRSFLDKIGLVADAFSGNDMNRRQLDEREARDFAVWQGEQQYQRRRADQLADAEAARNAPDYFQNKTGDYVRYDPATGEAKVVYDGPAAPVTPTALEQQVALLRRLNPAMTDLQAADVVQRGIAGAQYDPSVYKPMVDYKAGVARATKAAPTYAALHPKAGSSSGGAKPAKPSATLVIGGKAYYKIGGRWYDNAGGQ